MLLGPAMRQNTVVAGADGGGGGWRSSQEAGQGTERGKGYPPKERYSLSGLGRPARPHFLQLPEPLKTAPPYWVWWHMPLVPALGGRDRWIFMSLRPAMFHDEFQDSQGYITAKATFETLSQNNPTAITKPNPTKQ